jgi:glycosyltransferase involved in cell wall biosynthesis
MAHLHLFGQKYGPGEEAEAWAISKGISAAIHFEGVVPHARLLSMLMSFDVLLHPALEESCPMGIAEAMAVGLPVVAGERSGGIPWMVGSGGFLTDVTSPASISDGLFELLNNPDLQRQCILRSKARAAELFSSSNIVDLYEKKYLDAMSQ